MRELFSISYWRWPHWLVAIGSLLYLGVYTGVIPPPQDFVSWLESRPEVAGAFRDPNFGRADALLIMLTTVFIGPLIVFLGIVAVVFVMAVLGGFVLPIVRWANLPEWVATMTVLATMVTVACVERDVWLPRSLWFLALLARAFRAVLA